MEETAGNRSLSGRRLKLQKNCQKFHSASQTTSSKAAGCSRGGGRRSLGWKTACFPEQKRFISSCAAPSCRRNPQKQVIGAAWC